MLRLIGTSYIEIALREKEKWINPNFLKGLVIAALFHLFLLFCFQIAAPSNPDTIVALAPITVEVDLSLPTTSAPHLPTLVSPIEKIDPPELLEMPIPSCKQLPTNLFKYISQEPDFSQIEKIEYISNLEKKA